MKRIRITALLFALFILGISSCAQKTCPTYTKDNTQPSEIRSERM